MPTPVPRAPPCLPPCTPPRGLAPLAAALPRPPASGSSLCNQALSVPSGRLTPRNHSFSDIYALNRRPDTAGSCLLSLHGIIRSFQEPLSVSGSASLSPVRSALPATPEEKPRITPASQRGVRERGAQTRIYGDRGDLVHKAQPKLVPFSREVRACGCFSGPARRIVRRSQCCQVTDGDN